MLNWRPVREIELEIEQVKQRSWQNESEAEQRRMQSEWRMKQLESEIEQIKSETEQLRRGNARLRQLNAKGRALLSCVDQHCFPPESSSTPPQPTEIDCGPSLP
jgi:predicted RNase H-like nuclease (RuvC/YqgF family)